MTAVLAAGQILKSTTSAALYRIGRTLGEGGQGTVYEADTGAKSFALKWYHDEYLEQDPHIRDRIPKLIEAGTPSDRFLWPFDIVEPVPHGPRQSGFGYVMGLREPRFSGMVDLMGGRCAPTFSAILTAAFELAQSFLTLHSKGWCYRDISFGNCFFDPNSGEIRVCDNDNVDFDGRAAIIGGTPGFIAPELMLGAARHTSQKTDLYSLSVLLFHLLFVAHPLDGAREAAIHCFDQHAKNRLYGSDPVFIFDPNNASNRPVPGIHDNAVAFWSIYPQTLRDLFTKAFTAGLRDPDNGRVRETQWRQVLVRTRDALLMCGHCQAENFYEESRQAGAASPAPCWNCQTALVVPPRLRVGKEMVVLNAKTQLYAHHLAGQQDSFDFSRALAAVAQHPTQPSIWGLKNLSGETWVATTREGRADEVAPGRSVTLAAGTRLAFGKVQGEIQV